MMLQEMIYLKRSNMNLTSKLVFLVLVLGIISCGRIKQTNEGTETLNTSVGNVQLNRSGVFINHKVCGSGNITLLFVHGWCIDQSYWSNQFDQFCPNYKVVTIDLPGFGKSGKNRDNWTIEEYAKDIETVINQLKLTNVVLVGHSMGGDIILEVANHNEEVIALIGIDNFKEVGIEYDEQMQAEIDGFIGMLKENYQEIAPAYAEGLLFHPTTDSLVKIRVKNDFKTADSSIAISSFEALFTYAPKEVTQLSQLKQKIYLINSDATRTNIEGLEATGASFEVIDINATGHYPMIEKPEEFNKLLKQTIEKIEAAYNEK